MTLENDTLFQNNAVVEPQIEEIDLDLDLEDPSGLTEALVGEGKKFKTSDDLAKAKIFSDKHIARLERENSALRAAVAQQKNLDTLLEAIKKNQNSKTSNDDTNANDDSNTNTDRQARETLRPEDVVSKVLQELEKKEQTKVAQNNLNVVKQALQANLGSNFASKIQEQANELGLSPTDVDNLAKTKPQAFFRLFNIDPNKKAQADNTSLFSSPPTSTVNPAARNNNGGSSGVRNEAYYDNLRKKDPQMFFRTEIQAQMHRDAMKLGEAFFTKK